MTPETTTNKLETSGGMCGAEWNSNGSAPATARCLTTDSEFYLRLFRIGISSLERMGFMKPETTTNGLETSGGMCGAEWNSNRSAPTTTRCLTTDSEF